MAEGRRDHWWLGALAALTVAGAALRFATLSVQSFWLDEAVTHQLVTRSLGSMLSAIPHSESTPPLYYVLAWAWVRIFGSGEAGLRSLSALFGTATIVLLALIARRAAGRAAGLATAAIAASSPLLIWYSQEARAYGLLVMLCALTVWCLMRADWLGWGLAAALALATHYFAVFVVVPQAAWIGWRHRGELTARSSRAAGLALLGVGVVAAALAPLAVAQAGGDRARFISAQGLGRRLAQVPKQFLIGYATPHATVLTVAAVAVAVALAIKLRRGDRGLLALALIAVGVPVALALAGADYLITRNLIAAMVPLVALAGIAASRTRYGPALVAALCLVGVVAFIGVENNALYQRDDWRAVGRALAHPAHTPRVVVVNPSDGAPALELYAKLRALPQGQTFRTAEIDVVNLEHNPPPPNPIANGFGFCAPPTETPEFDLVRYCATVRVPVPYRSFANLTLIGKPPSILVGP